MMVRDWDLLFSEYDLRAVLENQLASVDKKVRDIPQSRFDTETDEFLAATVASELVVAPLELLEENLSVSSREAQIDVSYDPNRLFFEQGPHYVSGLEITYHVPYKGDTELWKCQPNQFTFNPPRAVIQKDELKFPIDSANRDVAATKHQYDQHISAVKQWLPWVNSQVTECNTQLESRVRASVVSRRTQLDKTKTDIAALGLPVRSSTSTTRTSASKDLPARRAAKRQAARRKYDVALSFAGEDREYVEKVAEALQAAGVSVFYDRFETVDLWGKDLAAHLGRVYSEDSHFVVLFASRHYAEKAWPTHERQFALSRAFKGDAERVLPVRFDDTEIPGLPSTIGYLDVRVLSPDKLAELIRQKLDAE